MGQIARLHQAEMVDGQTIEAVDINDNLDQIISESNAQDIRQTNLESSDMNIAGVKTYVDGIITNTITERTIGSGVQIDGVRNKDSMVLVSGTPTTAGEIGYTNSRFVVMEGTTVTNFTPTFAAISRSSNTSLTRANWGTTIICTGTFTQTFDAVATLPSGWLVYIKNAGTGVITLDPNSSELIDGFTSINLGPQSSCTIISNGTSLTTIGRPTEFILLRDEKSSGTEGGTFTTGNWQTRTLNTEVIDTANNCVLSSNQFTLQPGTYRVTAIAPALACNSHQAALVNISTSAFTAMGTSAFANTQSSSHISAQFTITTASIYEIQHRCETTRATDGFGQAVNFAPGNNEVYTAVQILKLV